MTSERPYNNGEFEHRQAHIGKTPCTHEGGDQSDESRSGEDGQPTSSR